MKKTALIALLLAFAAPAMAEGFYVLTSVGQTKTDLDQGYLDGADRALPGFQSSTDKTDTGYKLQLGYQFNQYFALEGGYVNLGKATYQGSAAGIGNKSVEFKASGVNLDAVGILPLNDRLSVFAKAGAIYAKVERNASRHNGLGNFSSSTDSTDLKGTWGLGASYDLSKNLAVRAEYEQFHKLGKDDQTGEANVDMLSVGIACKF